MGPFDEAPPTFSDPMIDLGKDQTRIRDFIGNGIERFESSVGRPTWVGVYTSPVNGWVMLCFDTSEVPGGKWLNCPDFEYVEHAWLEMPEWREASGTSYDAIEKGEGYISIVDHSGRTVTFDDHDLDYEEPFFRTVLEATRTVRTDFEGYEFFVQVLDSDLGERV